MAVYFVYRSEYHGPSGKYLRRFDDETVLKWFQKRWRGEPDYEAAHTLAKELLGTEVYGFGSLFNNIAEHDVAKPRSAEQLEEYLEEHLYVEGEVLFSPHVIQVNTDDDEIELAYFFFDDHFLARHGSRAAFLLHEDWKLPAKAGKGKFEPQEETVDLERAEGEGTTYLAFLGAYDSGEFDHMDAYRIEGIRLPQFSRYLAEAKPSDGWPFPLLFLRSQLFAPVQDVMPEEEGLVRSIAESPRDEMCWGVYSDWLEERSRAGSGLAILERALRSVGGYHLVQVSYVSDYQTFGLDNVKAAYEQVQQIVSKPSEKKLTHDPALSPFFVAQHLAQACPFAGWQPRMNHQWIFFDDLWASAHPDLANGVLRYARRWDVLSD